MSENLTLFARWDPAAARDLHGLDARKFMNSFLDVIPESTRHPVNYEMARSFFGFDSIRGVVYRSTTSMVSPLYTWPAEAVSLHRTDFRRFIDTRGPCGPQSADGAENAFSEAFASWRVADWGDALTAIAFDL
jgi:hypothetical protein